MILRFVVLTYMGFFFHDLAKPTHMLSNMLSNMECSHDLAKPTPMLSNIECQPQRDPFSDFNLVYFLIEAENVVGAGKFNLMGFMTN